ncbi:hypothetical protein PS662_06014 [Pseudomonas fluorescens]|uniref:Uncharacterized protein n=1 Tax=Pseudomonas fluorescens TaxID=294 RepID=A0A5E6Y0Z9_PSEFL|nr:hypothetical protein PS662_06014 [Pseudomonas fluorescens]
MPIFGGLPRFFGAGLPAKAVLQAAKFLGKVVGSFLQVVAVCMNWCAWIHIDRLLSSHCKFSDRVWKPFYR